MPGISVHVVDVSGGIPARGMRVAVHVLDAAGTRRRVGGGAVGDSGVVDDAVLAAGDGLAAGTYEVELAAGEWYRSRGDRVGAPAFQETVVFRFTVTDAAAHLHLPFKLTPWGLSVWRGA